MAQLTLKIERERLSGTALDGTPFEAPATVQMTFSKEMRGAWIVGIGRGESEFSRELEQGALRGDHPQYRVVRPGEDERWDRAWRSWRLAKPSAPIDCGLFPDDLSALFIHPLRKEAWAPELVSAMFRYEFRLHARGAILWLPWFRPRVTVEIADDFDDVERGELADALADAWVISRIVYGTPASARPATRAAAGLQRLKSLKYGSLAAVVVVFCVPSRLWPAEEFARIILSVFLFFLFAVVRERKKALEIQVNREGARSRQS